MECKHKPTARDWADLLALTLYLSGGRVRGRTRLQKLAFLVWQRLKRAGELPPRLRRLACLEFRPANYGPYSPELAREGVRLAERERLIRLEKPLGKPEVYILTEKGAERARAIHMMLRAIGLQLDGEIESLAALPLQQLVRLVYDTYPEYTIKSRIKERLESGAVVAWGPLEEGDIELVNDLIREGAIKMHGPIYLDHGQEYETALGKAARVFLRWMDRLPRIFVTISPRAPEERSSRE